MLFILVASLLSLYTIQSNKSHVADVSPIENVEISNQNTQKTTKSSKINQKDSLIQEENNSDSLSEEVDRDFSDILNEENSLNEENDLDDEYEEIIFYDDFDKEYWDWTEDNYLEE